jgi:AcrR family transcriptional regulator
MTRVDEKGAASGLRERKKALTRATIIETASALFHDRGFEKVTTAEIADAANVSVKTLFTYFPTKEDLLFHGEDEFRDVLLDLLRNRPSGASAFDTVARYLNSLSQPSQAATLVALENLRTSLGENRTLRARLTLMWERFEDAVSELLIEEAGSEKHGPACRLVASQLIAMVRMLMSDELKRHLDGRAPARRAAAFREWLRQAMSLVGKGIEDFGRR